MIFEKDNFATQKDFEVIDLYMRTTSDWKQDPDNWLWNNRCINISNHSVPDKQVFDSCKNILNNIKEQIASIFKVKKDFYPELFQITRTFPMQETTPHSDSTDNNGENNGTSHRSFSSILYLNRDFEGGDLWFPNQNITIRPQSNKLTIFPSTFEYIHGVREVVSGIRYHMMVFWTYDMNMAYAHKGMI